MPMRIAKIPKRKKTKRAVRRKPDHVYQNSKGETIYMVDISKDSLIIPDLTQAYENLKDLYIRPTAPTDAYWKVKV